MSNIEHSLGLREGSVMLRPDTSGQFLSEIKGQWYAFRLSLYVHTMPDASQHDRTVMITWTEEKRWSAVKFSMFTRLEVLT